MAQQVFRRVEKKYLLDKEQYLKLMEQMITYISPDQYGKHTIRNIYFDTDDYSLIRTSIEKPQYKEKIRLRSYGRPKENEKVFVELKKKCDGVVYKRRVTLPLNEARKYLYYGIYPQKDSQILKEIDYAVKRYQVKPAVYLAYDRIAFAGREDPQLRVTFDLNIRARSGQLELEKDGYDRLLLEPGQLVMEVKTPGAIPVWMCRLFSNLGIFPVSYSKYGTYYKQYIVPQRYLKEGGRTCA